MRNCARKMPVDKTQAKLWITFLRIHPGVFTDDKANGRLKIVPISGSRTGSTYWVDFTATKKIR